METRSPNVAADLQKKVRMAEAAYRRSREEYQRLVNLSHSTMDLNDPGFRDGQHALSQALKIHRYARQKYERTLQEFTEYVLNGKLPDGQ